ncbi:fumarylacetoacetate hydrolase family protein [Streptomyces sp. NPDC002018]|uniref:fumarylacetoacetate hydrolase family protein n=1 Tax=Streptomyces sp. NPDC002018 TaxID=3364629 RepID=UPI0036C275A8
MLVCAGSNYRSHVAEMDDTGKVTSKATSFVKSPSAIIGSGQEIVIPEQLPDMVDFEGEICVVFGRACHRVGVSDAMRYVGGYTILNDVSARDSVPAMLAATTPAEGQEAMLNMIMGKHLPTFAPVGPAIVTADEVSDPGKLHMVTRLNGVVMQDATTEDLVIDIPHLISQMSQFYYFRPGDILSTGTPAGVGFGRKPPVFLHPGDFVTVEVAGIGTLENTVRASSTAA